MRTQRPGSAPHLERRRMLSWPGMAALLGVLAMLWLASPTAMAAEQVRIGVLANNNVERCLTQWTPTATYLTAKNPGKTFSIVPLGFEQIAPALAEARVEFVICNPQIYIELEYKHQAIALATMRTLFAGQEQAVFGGAIIRRADKAGPNTLDGLRGKHFVAVDEKSLGGFLAAWGALKTAGINPYKDFSSLAFVSSHRLAVREVLEGRADAGTARTGTLEEMAAAGEISMEDVFVFPPPPGAVPDQGFAFLHSTALYPEWPFSKSSHVSEALARQVAAQLLEMTPDSPAAQAAGIKGWDIAHSYLSVLDLLTQLHLGPFKELGRVSAFDALRQHSRKFIAVLCGIVILAAFAAHTHRMNRKLKDYKTKLENELSSNEAISRELQQSGLELHQIFNTAAGGMRVIGPDCGIIKVNEAFLDLSGYTREEIEGNFCFDCFQGPLCGTPNCTLKRIQAGEGKLVLELEKIRKNGEQIVCELTATPYLSPSGTFLGIIEDFRDITKRKQAEAALAESETQHRIIFEHAPLGIAYLDSKGQVLKANAMFWGILERAPDKANGAGLALFAQALGKNALDSALAGEPSSYEGPLDLPGGPHKIVRIAFNPVMAAGSLPDVIVATVEDVTVQRLKEVELRNLWKTVEQCPASIVITDALGAIEYVNPYFTLNTGYSFEEVRGENPRLLKSGDHDAAFYEQMWRVLLSGSTWRGEISNKRKDGSLFWEAATISAVLNEHGDITNFIAVKEDVTERKKREEELKLALCEFEIIFNNSALSVALIKGDRIISRVNKRFLELFGYAEAEVLGQSADLLYGSLQTGGQFAMQNYESLRMGQVVQKEQQYMLQNGGYIWCNVYGRALSPPDLSAGIIWTFDDITPRKQLDKLREDVERIMRHDLKTPLNGIINLPELIVEEGGLSQNQKELLSYITQAGKRILYQVNLSLDLYKMETGRYRAAADPVDLVQVFEQARRDLGSLIREKGVDVRFEALPAAMVQGRAVMAQGDPQLCYAIVANLLKNAVEASSASDRVLVRLDNDGQAALGIHNKQPVPEAIRPFFFEKYVTSGKVDGTGLGTYSAKLMAELQGGSVTLTSDEASGTLITLRLPLA